MTATPELLAHDEASGRNLFFLHVPRPEALMALPEAIGRFVCLLVWDAAAEGVDVVSRIAEQLIASGCVYLCAWGTGCERVHDIFDEVIVGDGTQDVCADAPLVLTTWHYRESLDSATWFFLRSAFPEERVRAECRSSIAIVIGSDDERAAAVRRALSNPVEFSRRVGEDQE